MTENELFARVEQGILGFPDGTIADSELALLFDECQIRMIRLAKPRYMEKSYRENLVANQAEYSCQSDCLMLTGVKASNGTALRTLAPASRDSLDLIAGENWEDASAAAEITHWYMSDYVLTSGVSKFSLWPKPTSNVTSGLIHRYLRYPLLSAALAGGDEIYSIKKEYQDGLAHGMASLIGIRNPDLVDPGKVQAWSSIFNAAIESMAGEYGEPIKILAPGEHSWPGK